MSDHGRWADAAGAYVLGAMPEDERRQYEAHLEGCELCREEVEDLRPAAEALPVASMPIAPPASLKGRIMVEVEREAALLAEAGPDADRPRPRRRRRWAFSSGWNVTTGAAALPSRWRLAPAAAALLAVGVLAGFVVAGIGGGGTETFRATIDSAQVPGAQAELQIKDGEATLIAEGLPEPEGAYQVWLMPEDGDTPQPSVLILPRNGRATAAVPGAEDAAAVLVTREPKQGSRTPSEEPFLTVNVS
jgi:anti-sigma-K factor RskA